MSLPMIKAFGIGGLGGNVVQRLVAEGMSGIEVVVVDTDRRALEKSDIQTTLWIGGAITSGLAGTGHEAYSLPVREPIRHAVGDADMVLIIAGMGGGTGTRAGLAVAKIARRMDKFTVAAVTTPFQFESRHEEAERGVAALNRGVDSLIAIPNHKLLVVGEAASREDCFAAAVDMLCSVVRDILHATTRPGAIHDGFADVRTVMSGPHGGLATVGIGQAAGRDRAWLAIEAAIHSPLLDDGSLRHADSVVVTVTTAHNLRLKELDVVSATVREAAAKDSTIVVGTVDDRSVGESMRITVVAVDRTPISSQGRGRRHTNRWHTHGRPS